MLTEGGWRAHSLIIGVWEIRSTGRARGGKFSHGISLAGRNGGAQKELQEHCTSQLHIAHGQDGQIVAIPDEVLQSEFVTTYWAGIYYFPLVS